MDDVRVVWSEEQGREWDGGSNSEKRLCLSYEGPLGLCDCHTTSKKKLAKWQLKCWDLVCGASAFE